MPQIRCGTKVCTICSAADQAMIPVSGHNLIKLSGRPTDTQFRSRVRSTPDETRPIANAET